MLRKLITTKVGKNYTHGPARHPNMKLAVKILLQKSCCRAWIVGSQLMMLVATPVSPAYTSALMTSASSASEGPSRLPLVSLVLGLRHSTSTMDRV